jgi:hypothetical protein
MDGGLAMQAFILPSCSAVEQNIPATHQHISLSALFLLLL